MLTWCGGSRALLPRSTLEAELKAQLVLLPRGCPNHHHQHRLENAAVWNSCSAWPHKRMVLCRIIGLAVLQRSSRFPVCTAHSPCPSVKYQIRLNKQIFLTVLLQMVFNTVVSAVAGNCLGGCKGSYLLSQLLSQIFASIRIIHPIYSV